ncbi:LysR family transcriptional regulator (plasmid) [Photobacterium sp. DA100]|uniref:LysR family transcriptional regulator n=1 Tax=Photobacterium sp. DA100 TaxID=3027472 RepID=UPI002479094C|nr:LysR family transcriptional regulator [Photobacterium sp. DA100]WEM45162.1 LysR family transcriptional regulator [Photobacterium sp. DA100]
MYSFEQLKMFVAVCECGSFSAAARKHLRAQSGVSQSVSNLEIALNQTLFDRSSNMPTLTAQGEALLPIARAILLQQQRLDQKVMALDADEEHELVVAIEESVVEPDLLGQITAVGEQYPMTSIELISASTFDIKAMVSEGRAHIGVVYSDGKILEDTEFATVGYNRFLTLAAPQHPLAHKTALKDDDLRNYRQIVQRSSSGKELWFSYAISSQVWYANNHQLLLELAAQGLGWAIVPESLAASYVEQGKLAVLDLAYEPDGWLTTVDVIQTRRHSEGPVRQALLQILEKTLAAKPRL